MKTWFKIQAKAETPSAAEVVLYDDIGSWGVTAKEFIDQVRATGATDLTVRLNCYGGDVFQGLAIYNFLLGLPNVTTVVDGVAASMASVVFLAGKTRKIAGNAFVMVHAPWTMTAGNAEDLRNEADVLEKLQASLRSIYEKRTGADAATVDAWLASDTWFDAEEAKAAGLATEVSDPSTAVASLRPFFKNVPVALSANPNPQQKHRMKQLLEALAKLGLITSADVTEDAAVSQVNTNAAKLTKERDDAVTARTNAETALATARRKTAEGLVASAVSEGRIESTAAAEWTDRLAKDETAEKLLASIKKPTAPLGAAPLAAGNHLPPSEKKTLTQQALDEIAARAKK